MQIVSFFACKAAAFFRFGDQRYTGLDDVYRKLFRDQMSWEKSDSDSTVKGLKTYLMVLEEGIGNQR